MSITIKDLLSQVGNEVKNHIGENLGKLHDLIVDEKREKLEYLILACQDLFGRGTRYFAIPAQPFFVKFVNGRRVVISIKKDSLNVAIGVRLNECPKFDPELSKSVFELLYYSDSASTAGRTAAG